MRGRWAGGSERVGVDRGARHRSPDHRGGTTMTVDPRPPPRSSSSASTAPTARSLPCAWPPPKPVAAARYCACSPRSTTDRTTSSGSRHSASSCGGDRVADAVGERARRLRRAAKAQLLVVGSRGSVSSRAWPSARSAARSYTAHRARSRWFVPTRRGGAGQTRHAHREDRPGHPRAVGSRVIAAALFELVAGRVTPVGSANRKGGVLLPLGRPQMWLCRVIRGLRHRS